MVTVVEIEGYVEEELQEAKRILKELHTKNEVSSYEAGYAEGCLITAGMFKYLFEKLERN